MISILYFSGVLTEVISKIENKAILYAILIFFGVYLVISLILFFIGTRKGAEGSLLWGLFSLKPNAVHARLSQQYQDLNDEFDKLNLNDKLKSDIIKILNAAIVGAPFLGASGTYEDLKLNLERYYNLVFPGIISLFKIENDNNLRIGIFIKKGNNLVLHKGYAYPPESRDVLYLTNSRAGYCYINREVYYCSDLDQEPTFKANPNTNYKSLLCIPIMYRGEIIGVFNIDGEKKDSFLRDHINYINYIVNAVAATLHLELTTFQSPSYTELTSNDNENETGEGVEDNEVSRTY